MAVRWKSGANFNLLTAEINRVRVQKDGRVQYKGFEFEDLAETISGAIDFPRDVPGQIRIGSVQSALFKITHNNKLSPQDISSCVSNNIKHYLNQPVQFYWIRTSWSIDMLHPIFSSLQIGDEKITLGKVPRKFDQTSAFYQAKERLGLIHPKHYCPVLVKTSGRCEYSAIDSALDSSDLVRGLINYVTGYRNFRKTYIGRRSPVNDILPGTVHTVHNQDGSLVQDGLFWYNTRQSYVREKNYRTYPKLRKSMLLLKRRLEVSSMKTLASECLLLYVRALDHADWDACFFELWRALEHATCTSQRESYETTIRRASFLFDDRELMRQKLKHLRDRRNDYVHRALEHQNPELLIMQLRQYVQVLLRWLIANPHRFRNHEEFAEFLDSPDNSVRIEQKIRVLRAARKTVGKP